MNVKNIINSLKSPGWYKNDLKELKKQKGNDKTFVFGRMFPILSERNDEG